MVILVSGRFYVNLTVGKVQLERPGDYAVWGPGIDHSWKAENDWATPGILEALIPGRMQGHGGTEEVPG